jgi:hypothetical protein
MITLRLFVALRQWFGGTGQSNLICYLYNLPHIQIVSLLDYEILTKHTRI